MDDGYIYCERGRGNEGLQGVGVRRCIPKGVLVSLRLFELFDALTECMKT